MLSKQKKRMKHVDDNHVYHYMFVAGLEKRINAEVLRLPESLHIEEMEFHEVLELAKRAEQTVKSHTNSTVQGQAKLTKAKPSMRPNDKGSHQPSNRINRERLTSKEKEFLNSNLKHRGGLIVYKHIYNKLEWIN